MLGGLDSGLGRGHAQELLAAAAEARRDDDPGAPRGRIASRAGSSAPWHSVATRPRRCRRPRSPVPPWEPSTPAVVWWPRAFSRPYEQWWGGRPVPMAGIAGVAVAPEARGQGLVRQLFDELLPRRRCTGQLAVPDRAVDLPPARLGGGRHLRLHLHPADLAADEGTRPRCADATEDDLPAIEALYDGRGSAVGSGWLVRRGRELPRWRQGDPRARRRHRGGRGRPGHRLRQLLARPRLRQRRTAHAVGLHHHDAGGDAVAARRPGRLELGRRRRELAGQHRRPGAVPQPVAAGADEVAALDAAGARPGGGRRRTRLRTRRDDHRVRGVRRRLPAGGRRRPGPAVRRTG